MKENWNQKGVADPSIGGDQGQGSLDEVDPLQGLTNIQELQEVSFLAQELYAEANNDMDSLSSSLNGGVGLIPDTDPNHINYMIQMMGSMSQVFNTDNPFEVENNNKPATTTSTSSSSATTTVSTTTPNTASTTPKQKEKPPKQKTYRYHAYVPKTKGKTTTKSKGKGDDKDDDESMRLKRSSSMVDPAPNSSGASARNSITMVSVDKHSSKIGLNRQMSAPVGAFAEQEDTNASPESLQGNMDSMEMSFD
eukprot:Nk52_evm2s304 gene=Nk52_evmTU2s304